MLPCFQRLTRDVSVLGLTSPSLRPNLRQKSSRGSAVALRFHERVSRVRSAAELSESCCNGVCVCSMKKKKNPNHTNQHYDSNTQSDIHNDWQTFRKYASWAAKRHFWYVCCESIDCGLHGMRERNVLNVSIAWNVLKRLLISLHCRKAWR